MRLKLRSKRRFSSQPGAAFQKSKFTPRLVVSSTSGRVIGHSNLININIAIPVLMDFDHIFSNVPI